MDMVINAFTENPMLLVAVIVFLICVVIGFFGDKYLRSQNKIGKILESNKEEKEEVLEETRKEDELLETNPTLITSENVNIVNAQNQTVNLPNETNVQNQMINDSVISFDASAIANNPFSPNNLATSEKTELVSNDPTDIANNVVITPLDNTSQEISEPIVPEVYPAENNPQDVLSNPVPFDGQIISDENINNMF